MDPPYRVVRCACGVAIPFVCRPDSPFRASCRQRIPCRVRRLEREYKHLPARRRATRARHDERCIVVPGDRLRERLNIDRRIRGVRHRTGDDEFGCGDCRDTAVYVHSGRLKSDRARAILIRHGHRELVLEIARHAPRIPFDQYAIGRERGAIHELHTRIEVSESVPCLECRHRHRTIARVRATRGVVELRYPGSAASHDPHQICDRLEARERPRRVRDERIRADSDPRRGIINVPAILCDDALLKDPVEDHTVVVLLDPLLLDELRRQRVRAAHV